jgi:hypothetical protein
VRKSLSAFWLSIFDEERISFKEAQPSTQQSSVGSTEFSRYNSGKVGMGMSGETPGRKDF